MYRNDKLYQDLFQLYVKVYPQLSRQQCQTSVNEKWKVIKKGKDVDEDAFKQEMTNLRSKIGKGTIQSFFNKPRPVKPPVLVEDITEVEEVASEGSSAEGLIVLDDEVTEGSESGSLISRKYDTPSQNKLKEELSNTELSLARLIEARNLAIGGCDESKASLTKRIKEVTKIKDGLKSKLKRVEQNVENQKKLREKKKLEMEKLKRDFPEIALTLSVREEPGRPRLEEDQPNLNTDILEIATIGAACSDRRREELFRTEKTLDQLHAALQALGYKISRSGVYLRLLPRDATTSQGKKHVKSVPVRLVRPEEKTSRSDVCS